MTMETQVTQFDVLKSDVAQLIPQVEAIQIVDEATAERAREGASLLKGLAKRIIERRKELIKPLQAQIDAIEAYANEVAGPLSQLEERVTGELRHFAIKQETARQEAERKAEEEIAAEKVRLEAERQKAEAELIGKQDSVREAHEQEQKVRATAARLFGGPGAEPRGQQFAMTIEERQNHALLVGRAQIEKNFNEQIGRVKKAVGSAIPGRVKGEQKHWDVEILDINLIPAEFLNVTVKRAELLKAARAGRTEIPGVRLFQDTRVTIRGSTFKKDGAA
jgi:hypothetical protein